MTPFLHPPTCSRGQDEAVHGMYQTSASRKLLKEKAKAILIPHQADWPPCNIYRKLFILPCQLDFR
jgi:hypothetical protein